MSKYSKILFLCVANSARSQMAEIIAKKILPSTVKIRSAGSRPGARIHPVAVQTMIDFNAEISESIPKSIGSLPVGFLDEECLIVRLCAEEECPIISQSIEVRDWTLPDPANPNDGDVNLAFAKTRKKLIERIYELKKELFEI